MSVQILLADDHQVVRDGLRLLLAQHFNVAAEAADGREAVRLARELAPDIAVLDYSMPRLNGLEAAREIHNDLPSIRIILLTMHTADRYVHEALRAGVKGYVVKTQAAEDLVRAIHELCAGHVYLSPSISGTILEGYLSGTGRPTELLTAQERRILQLIAEGNRTKEIAQVLGISVKTAESHRSRIMDKLEIHDIAGLVRYAIREGLIEP
jgi:two-component system, NarL family, response regulator NreC